MSPHTVRVAIDGTHAHLTAEVTLVEIRGIVADVQTIITAPGGSSRSSDSPQPILSPVPMPVLAPTPLPTPAPLPVLPTTLLMAPTPTPIAPAKPVPPKSSGSTTEKLNQIKQEVLKAESEYRKNHHWFREKLINQLSQTFKNDKKYISLMVYSILEDIK